MTFLSIIFILINNEGFLLKKLSFIIQQMPSMYHKPPNLCTVCIMEQ